MAKASKLLIKKFPESKALCIWADDVYMGVLGEIFSSISCTLTAHGQPEIEICLCENYGDILTPNQKRVMDAFVFTNRVALTGNFTIECMDASVEEEFSWGNSK